MSVLLSHAVHDNRPGTLRSFITTASVLAALVLAGCSDSGSGTAVSGTDDTPASSTTTAAPRPAYTSEVYAKGETWLCRPDRTDDACDVDLDATLVEPDGTTTVEELEPDDDAPIDCFYVYPTASDDPTPNSDLIPSTETYMARTQAAPFATTCRVFAPMYRQVTLAGLLGRTAGDENWALAYDDVLDAWRHYLANDNDGRGVVLIGHSQGSNHLEKLLDEEIDGDEAVRSQLVSAIITGGSVAVPEGEDVGGIYENIPLCRADDQTGCLITYSTYSPDVPPVETSFFGVVPPEDGRAACVNPAALDGGPAPFDSILPTDSLPAGQLDAAITTPFVHLVGLVEGECVEEGKFTFLEATTTPEPGDERPADVGGTSLPGWGLHRHDLGLPMGNLRDLITTQTAAFEG